MIFPILLACLVAGVAFAALAAWLTTRKGNTIKDVLDSERFSDSEAVKIEILGRLKVASNIPIVGLYIVSLAVALALPAFISWQILKEVTVVTLSGTVENLQPDKKLYIMPKSMRVESSGSFDLPLLYSKKTQAINIEGKDYFPVTLKVSLNKLKATLSVEIANSSLGSKSEDIELDLETMRANLPRAISLVDAPSERPVLSNRATPASAVAVPFENVAGPPEVTGP